MFNLKKKINVSVIVVNYNKSLYIKKCLESLVAQKFKKFEVIFFDDFSSDNSVVEAKKFVDKLNLKIIKNKNKKEKFGSYNQINSYSTALKFCNGELIFLLDSDDFFSKNKIFKIVKFFSRFPNKDIIFDLPFIYYSNNKVIKFRARRLFLFTLWPKFPPQSCIAIKKNFFNKVLKRVSFKKFPNIWLDFRIACYCHFVSYNFEVMRFYLTYYFQDPKGESSKFRFLSSNWWLRRNEAFNYIKFFFKKEKIIFKKNLDYLFTKIINKFCSFAN